MRFSLMQQFNSGLRDIVRTQSQTIETQNQIALGKRVIKPSDDPVASARILKIGQEQSQINQFIDNIGAVESRLGIEESQLNSVASLLQRVRELTVQAGNSYLVHTDRQIIATELHTRLDQLVDLANTKGPNGEYIFAGFQGSDIPFIEAQNGEIEYHGDDGQRFVSVATSTQIPINDSGFDIFVDIPAASTTLNATVGSNQNVTGVKLAGAGAISNIQLNDPNNNYSAERAADYQIDIAGGNYIVTDMSKSPPVVTVPATPYVSPTNVKLDEKLDGAGVSLWSITADITGAANGDSYSVQTNPSSSAMGAVTIGNVEKYPDNYKANFQIEMIDSGGGTVDQYQILDMNQHPPVIVDGPNGYAPGDPITITGAGVGQSFSIEVEFDKNVQDGDRYTVKSPAKQSMLETLRKIADGLDKFDNRDKEQLKVLISETLTNVGLAEENLSLVQAEIGARLNSIDSIHQMHSGMQLVNSELLSEIRDLDYAEAVSRLSIETFTLEAAQQSFVKISNLSLFKFLR